MSEWVTLDRAPLHASLTVVRVDAASGTLARLSALGLRRGAVVRLVQELAAGGRVVSVGGGRLALGRDVLAGLAGQVAA